MLPPEYEELDAYRLEKDWSWDELSRATVRARCGLPIKTLHHLIRRAQIMVPRDRTLYKIRKFLIWIEDNDGPALKRARVMLAKMKAKQNGDRVSA
jgi:hypothetical protein